MAALLCCSAFFSGSETALFSLTAHQRLRLTRDASFVGQAISKLLSHTRSLLITLLMGNMTINVLYFVTSTILLLRLGKKEWAGPVTMSILTLMPLLLVILLGEVMPKLIAARVPVTWARLTAVPLMLIDRSIAPIRIATNLVVITPLARLIAPVDRPAELSPEELDALMELSRKEGVIDHGEEQMLQQVLSLSQLKVRDLMTPRVDIIAFDLREDPAQLLAMIKEHRYSRVVVHRGDLDAIEGVVFARQALLNPPKIPGDAERLVRQVRYVPEFQRADQLLVQFRKTGTTLAVVVDEYGGTAGLITLEDVVEQMVGDIADPDESHDGIEIQSLGPGQWRVDADLSIREWSQTFGQRLLSPYQVSTIGGLVMAMLGALPKEGDSVEMGNLLITVEAMDAKRIKTLRLAVQATPTTRGNDVEGERADRAKGGKP